MKLSLVIPVYRCRESLEPLVHRFRTELPVGFSDYEAIFVDDGSPDGSFELLERLAEGDPHIKVVKLSRNFGQHRAIFAGLQYATGDWVAVMDCDLQHDPAYLTTLYEKAQREGLAIVLTEVERRSHSWWRNLLAASFRWASRASAGQSASYRAELTNYCLLRADVVAGLSKYREVHRHFLFLVHDVGFPKGVVRVEHRDRLEGRSSYDFRKLVVHAVDGIVAQSTRLLYVATVLGFSAVLVSFFVAAALAVSYFTGSRVPGWTSLIVVIFLSTGIVLFSLGILGLYVGKIFEQVKARPIYHVETLRNLEPR